MSTDGSVFDWKKLSLDLISWSSCIEMSHDAFAHFIQPGPPRISMCELLVPILGKREMPDLPLPEVSCAFLEPLSFPFCVF